jgi:hypothetical protein
MRKRGKWRVFLLLLCALALSAPLCGEKEQAGETPAQRAGREIRESLLLPPEAQYLGATVMSDKDRLLLNYGVNLTPEEVGNFFQAQITTPLLTTSENGVGYQDKNKRIVNYAWFPRDPDLYPYRTALHVAVYPLPEEIQKDPHIE